jgi:hypothetical protein
VGCWVGAGIAAAVGQRGLYSHSRPAAPIFSTILPPAYLSKYLTRALPTKDGGVLRTIADARAYMAAMPAERDRCARLLHAARLILE